MSNGDKEGFIVKFVESKAQKTEYAVKAYEVNSIIWFKLINVTGSLFAVGDFVSYVHTGHFGVTV